MIEEYTRQLLNDYISVLLCVIKINPKVNKDKTFMKLSYQLILPCLNIDSFTESEYRLLMQYFDTPYITPFIIPTTYHYLMREIYESNLFVSAMQNLVKDVLNEDI
jgi:hypothetical protein